MIITYSRKPTQRFTERVNTLMLYEQDWSYLVEAVDAKNKCEAVMKYLADTAKRESAISEDIITYLMTGMSWYDFCTEMQKKDKN